MIDTKKVKNSYKSVTVIAGAIYTIMAGFIMSHPDIIPMALKNIVSHEWLDTAKEFVIYFISAGGFSAIYYGRVRKSKELEKR
jgi:uncharacterized membrane protein